MIKAFCMFVNTVMKESEIIRITGRMNTER